MNVTNKSRFLQPLYYDTKIADFYWWWIPGTPHTTGGLLSPSRMAGNAKFQLEVSENEDVTFPASEFPDPLSSIHGPWLSVGLDGASQEDATLRDRGVG